MIHWRLKNHPFSISLTSGLVVHLGPLRRSSLPPIRLSQLPSKGPSQISGTRFVFGTSSSLTEQFPFTIDLHRSLPVFSHELCPTDPFTTLHLSLSVHMGPKEVSSSPFIRDLLPPMYVAFTQLVLTRSRWSYNLKITNSAIYYKRPLSFRIVLKHHSYKQGIKSIEILTILSPYTVVLYNVHTDLR